MVEPPLEVGALKEIVAWFGEEVAAETPVGCPGTDHCKVEVATILPVLVPAEFTAYARK